MPYATVNSKKLFYTISHPTTPSSASNTSSGTNTTSAFTLLLIHGLGSTSSFYSPILPALLTAGHTTLTLDTHGCGLSTYTGSGNSTVSIAEDALALLQHLEGQVPKNIVIVGHSMGCIVASELALRAAERVKGVVLLGPVHPNPGAAKTFEERIKIVEESKCPRSHPCVGLCEGDETN
jgi:pimeloyl-ACP methyl ester carboxylesterase